MKHRNLVMFFGILFSAGACIQVEPSKGEDYLNDNQVQTPTPVASQVATGEREIKQEYLSQQDLERRQAKLAEAESDYNEDPNDEQNIIWYGRRLAYLGRYQDAINIYTEGIRKFPNSYRLYRHRGHRYITLKQFDQAIEDLQNAAFYVSNVPGIEIEPDGIPNSLNRPMTNVKWNIYYHLGLAYYLKGNYDKAISSYKKCLEYSNNNVLDVTTTNWLYVTYRKIGNRDAADALIASVPSKMRLIEQRIYHDLIMLYKGFVTPDILIRRNTTNGNLDANVGYGIGNWYLLEGNVESAQNIFNRVIDGSQRDSFGYIATEVELQTLANTVSNPAAAVTGS